MQLYTLLLTLPVLLFADFTLLYKLDNNFTQELNYKDSNHILFTFKEQNKTFEKLLIENSNKYLSLYDGAIETIYQIDDNISTPINPDTQAYHPDFRIINKESNISYRGIAAEKWLIEENGKKQELIVSKEKALTEAVYKMIEALQKLLPNEKQKDAHIFNLGNGYILLKKESLEFLGFNQDKLNLSLFTIEKKLSKPEQQEFSKEIAKCFHSPCCGEKYYPSTTIEHWLHKRVDRWVLIQSAKCENIDTTSGLESALYSDKNSTIVIEMTTGSNNLYGKIESLQEQGIEIKQIAKVKVNGFKTLAAYLPFIDSTIVDIILPNTTFSIYQKGRKNLIPFAKKAIKFKRVSKF